MAKKLKAVIHFSSEGFSNYSIQLSHKNKVIESCSIKQNNQINIKEYIGAIHKRRWPIFRIL